MMVPSDRSSCCHFAAASAIIILLGTAYYWLARPPGSAAFLALMPAPPRMLDPVFFSRWLGWLPTFLHVLSFSLLTSLVLGRRHHLFACLIWGGINAGFELGQALPPAFLSFLPDSLNLHDYFSHGVFDPLDLAACAIGAWGSWALMGDQRLTEAESKPQPAVRTQNQRMKSWTEGIRHEPKKIPPRRDFR